MRQDLKASGEGSLLGRDSDDRFFFPIWQHLKQQDGDVCKGNYGDQDGRE